MIELSTQLTPSQIQKKIAAKINDARKICGLQPITDVIVYQPCANPLERLN